MIILHTETSLGWGGQEIRIFEESLSMRDEGYTILLAAPSSSKLYERMKIAGFTVFPLSFRWSSLWRLGAIIRKYRVDLINTHSSKDSWVGGVAARLFGCRVVRTRHLSTPVKTGLNSHILYRFLADAVVTTCEKTAQQLAKQSRQKLCRSIPTGVKLDKIQVNDDARIRFGIPEGHFVVGTLCVLRSWKGVQNLLQAAALCQELPITWLIVGDGSMRPQLQEQAKSLKNIIFTGHVEPPYEALAAMDLFALLSSKNEGVSQATLQAGILGKPLITTTTGGLPEVCLHGTTGFHTYSPEETANYVKRLYNDQTLRESMGRSVHTLVKERFTFDKTVAEMKKVYQEVLEEIKR